MLVSMTGYGQSFIENENYRINVEMKSVNHRFSEVTIRMPRQFLFLEDRLKKSINQFVQRGKVDVFLTIEGEGLVERTLQVDWDLLKEFYLTHERAQEKLAVTQQLNLEKLLLHPDVVTVLEKDNQSETLVELIASATKKATEELLKMRQKEGSALAVDLTQRLKKLGAVVANVEEHTPGVIEAYQQRLLKRMEELLDEKLEVEESRVLTEVAIFSDKANIDEELTRLKSHLEQFMFIIEQHESGAVGRKLDFLVQEMNREVNTVGSKSNDIYINKQVVELKAELEKIKEQVQNIE
ncbi:YicC family protein [Anaerobacillus arseniciselenatis]|uniref:YicC family protein n=1 Tax=Anaerobacillus arseniciselenatis TaxID=85682 RepID=A0A1S2LEA0_9BACI|nr:YicC/YloC family endoribonuclease [Anaerobacillus arseniciselenatis]OIJ09845.1 YicC family protein [Anaerobacillus arseniciselenatis]